MSTEYQIQGRTPPTPTQVELRRRYLEAKKRMESGDIRLKQPKQPRNIPTPRDWLRVADRNIRLPRWPEREAGPALFEIKRAVSDVTGVSKVELESPRRFVGICYARNVYYWLARELTPCSYPQIGRSCGHRDHSTVIHGVNKVAEDIAEKGDTSKFLATIRAVKIKLGVPV